MADQFSYQYPPHSHYRSEHVQLPMARSNSEFASPPQQHSSPYYSEPEDVKEFGSPYSAKAQPFDAGFVSPPQQPVYPMLHKDVSYALDLSDARSMATSRYPTFNTPPQQGQVQEKPPRFWHKILPNSMACRLYLLTVLIETIVDIAIEVDLLVLVNAATAANDKTAKVPDKQSELKLKRLPIYLVVFGLAHVFQLALALDAVHAQNTLQFLFLAVFNALLLIYAVVQKSEISASINPEIPGMANIPVDALTAIIIAVIGLSQVAYIALGYKIYTEFGWKVYKLLGADRGIKRMFMHLQVFLCLTKFDVFFFVGFGVQWIFLVLEEVNFEYYLTIAALPFSIVVLFIGHRAAHKEQKWLMGTFIAGSTAACVYFVYKFWKILVSKEENVKSVFKSLMIFSVLAIVLLVTTFAWAIIVMHNFGQGLKGRVSKHKNGASMALSSRTGRMRQGSQFEMGTHPHRLSID